MQRSLILVATLFLGVLAAAQNPPAQPAPQPQQKTVKTYACPQCQASFKSQRELKKHLVKAHGMKYYCAACNMGFKTKAELNAHKKDVHANK